jgi:heterodisulfide reductase subunit B
MIELKDLRDIMNSDGEMLDEVRGRVQEMDKDYKGVARLKDISEAIMGCYGEKLTSYSIE